MTVQDLIDWLRRKIFVWVFLDAWNAVREEQESLRKLLAALSMPNFEDAYDALMDDNGKMIRSQELQARIDALETAYATDPRRAEIAKEKAEAPTVIGGFTPRSKRIRNWEADRKAKPKSE